MWIESFSFGNDNKLKIFPPNSFKFKPKDHIIIDEVKECILGNFCYQYNNKREERGYMLSILNSLAEYFHMTNEALSKYDDHDSIEQKHIYVIFEGSKPEVYISFEEIIRQKVGTKYTSVFKASSRHRLGDKASRKMRRSRRLIISALLFFPISLLFQAFFY
jgi:hypothetical protein